MSNNTLQNINKITGTLATVIGGTGVTYAADAVASGTADTGTLVVSIMTSLTSIIYGVISMFKKKTVE